MGNEKIDGAAKLMEQFEKDLLALNSNDSYANFALRYFHTQEKKILIANLTTLADQAGRNLGEMKFSRYFRLLARKEFAAKIATFQDEEIRLGLML